MPDFDFQPYLDFVQRHYSETQGLYTPTDAVLPLVEKNDRTSGEQENDLKSSQEPEQLPVLDGLWKYALGDDREHVLLAGRPGLGKSMALRQLVVALASEGQVPVLVQLKGDRSVSELIKAEFRRAKVRVTDDQINDWLFDDRLVLLLDGINEIPTEKLRQDLSQFREDNLSVPMVFTTRDFSIGGDLGIGKRFEMKPLSPEQLREFVGKYLPGQGERLLEQLDGGMREIAETPLLLRMLCDVFDPETEQIPSNKSELFEWFDRDYERVKKAVEYVPVSENFWLFKSQILHYLAFKTIEAGENKPHEVWYSFPRDRAANILEDWLRSRNMTDAPTKALLWMKDLVNCHLLQKSQNPDEIEFHHQLFQEYYAAKWLLMQVEKTINDQTLKGEYLNYLKWTEPIALLLGLCEEDIAIPIVKQALDVDLMLGARLAGEVRSDFQEISVEALYHKAINSHAAIWLMIILFCKTKSHNAARYLSHIIQNSEEVINRNQVTWALRNIPLKSAIPVFQIALKDVNESVRNHAVRALGESKSNESIPVIMSVLKDPSPKVRQSMIYALEGIACSESVFGILKVLADAQNRYRAGASSSGKIADWWKPPSDEMSGESNIITMAQYIFKEKIDYAVASPALLQVLAQTDQDSCERQYAAEILGVIAQRSDDAVFQTLTDSQQDPDRAVAYAARDALRKLEAKSHQENSACQTQDYKQEPIQIWIDYLNSPDEIVRGNAVIKLAELLERDAAIEIVKSALKDTAPYVKSHAVRLFTEFIGRKSLDMVMQILYDEYLEVQRAAVQALIMIQGMSPDKIKIELREEFIQDLVKKVWENSQSYDGVQATEILTNLFAFQDNLASRPDVKAALLTAIETPDYLLRSYALTGLQKIHDKDVVNCLEVLLSDPNELTSGQAAEALGKMPQQLTAEILPRLKLLMLAQARNSAVEAIATIQSNCKFYDYEIQQAEELRKADRASLGGGGGDPFAKIEKKLEAIDRRTQKMADQPKNNFSGASFSGPVNFGDNPTGDFVVTQNKYTTDPEIKRAIADLKTLITDLQIQHPTVTTEAQAIEIIDAEFTEIKRDPNHKLTTLRKQVLNPERHLQAIKATAAEVAKHYLEESVWAKASITYIDKLSETPDKGV